MYRSCELVSNTCVKIELSSKRKVFGSWTKTEAQLRIYFTTPKERPLSYSRWSIHGALFNLRGTVLERKNGSLIENWRRRELPSGKLRSRAFSQKTRFWRCSEAISSRNFDKRGSSCQSKRLISSVHFIWSLLGKYAFRWVLRCLGIFGAQCWKTKAISSTKKLW